MHWPTGRRHDDESPLAAGLDQDLDAVALALFFVRRLRASRQLGVPADDLSAIQPVYAAARCVLTVAPLDPLDEVTEAGLLCRVLELVIRGPVVELETLQPTTNPTTDEAQASSPVCDKPGT